MRIEQFPDIVVARLMNFQPAPLLKFSVAEKRDVDIRDLFNGS